MSKIEIIAAGRLKKGALFELCDEYLGRIKWPAKIHEIESRLKDPREMQVEEQQKIEACLKKDCFIVMLDERGKTLGSVDFTKTIEKLRNESRDIQFVIGGAAGLGDELRKRANLLLSFGAQTWPHMLARVMLLEQIYRAQQILAGHPYHRE